MSLTLPTVEDLYRFWGDEADDSDEVRAELLIELAANLLWLATGLDDDPEDPRLASLVKLAILDMAIYLYINRDNVTAEYSPFSSERIGSYSYSKAFSRASSSVSSANKTGATIFDQLVEYLSYQAMGSWVSSEYVFEPGFVPLEVEVSLARLYNNYFEYWTYL